MESLQSRLANSESRPWPHQPVPVMLVITDLDVGGAERAMVSLATRLDRSRWRPSVVCLGAEGKLAGPLRDAEIPVVCLEGNRRRPLQIIARLRSEILAIHPALIQSFLFHANFATKLAARSKRLPWVVGGIRVAEREKRWHLTLDRLTQRFSAGSICVSEGVYRFSRDVGKIDPARLAVIPNGIDPAPFDRIAPSRGHRTALFVGRMARQKGVSLLLDAWEAVREWRPGWSLVLVGDGPDLPALKARNIDNIQWLGRRDDVPNLMKSADLLVLPSLWEGMPNVVLEGMAAGLPILATQVEGSEDLVIAQGPERNGWLAEPGEGGALAKELREALVSTEVLRVYGERSRERVEQRFSMARVVAAYERIWAGLLGLENEGKT